MVEIGRVFGAAGSTCSKVVARPISTLVPAPPPPGAEVSPVTSPNLPRVCDFQKCHKLAEVSQLRGRFPPPRHPGAAESQNHKITTPFFHFPSATTWMPQ